MQMENVLFNDSSLYCPSDDLLDDDVGQLSPRSKLFDVSFTLEEFFRREKMCSWAEQGF